MTIAELQREAALFGGSPFAGAAEGAVDGV
jgi:hypothetical protein